MAILFFQRDKEGIYLIDSYENRGEGIPFYIKYLKDKPYVYGKHFAPFDINQKELTSGKTRQAIARELGINFIEVPSASIIDGIERARIMFSRLHIDNLNCEQFIVAIKNYRKEWDDKLLDYKPKPVHDWTSHFADALRYSALVEPQMKVREGKTGSDWWEKEISSKKTEDKYSMFRKI
jgi:phage terminase large subunit